MIKEFKIPVYGEDSPQRIILLISPNEKKYGEDLKKLRKKYGVLEETTFYEWNEFRAFLQLLQCANKKTHFLLVWQKGEKHISTLVHECVHLVNFIFESRGVKSSMDNDEIFTYYQEKLFNMLYPYLFHPAKPI
ncbi:MAG: hypothetical protein ACP5N7_01340 [Candidatus Pacearchaeota archaeon]